MSVKACTQPNHRHCFGTRSFSDVPCARSLFLYHHKQTASVGSTSLPVRPPLASPRLLARSRTRTSVRTRPHHCDTRQRSPGLWDTQWRQWRQRRQRQRRCSTVDGVPKFWHLVLRSPLGANDHRRILELVGHRCAGVRGVCHINSNRERRAHLPPPRATAAACCCARRFHHVARRPCAPSFGGRDALGALLINGKPVCGVLVAVRPLPHARHTRSRVPGTHLALVSTNSPASSSVKWSRVGGSALDIRTDKCSMNMVRSPTLSATWNMDMFLV